MQVNEQSSSYYAWIPTSTGDILFNLIAQNPLLKSKKTTILENTIKIEKLDLSIFSDTYNNDKEKILELYIEEEEIPAKADVNLSYDKEKKVFIGDIKLFIENNIFYSCKFKFEKDGKIEIFDINMLDKKITEDSIAQYFFVLIKLLVHGDSHHHQKIDTITFVMKDYFDCLKVISDFKDHTKRIQVTFKKLSKDELCSKLLRIETIEHEINGYMSYLKTFKELFCNRDKVKTEKAKKEIRIIENIKESIISHSNVTKKKNIFLHTTMTYMLVILGVIFSFLILLGKLTTFGYQLNIIGFLILSITMAVSVFYIAKTQLYCRAKSLFADKCYYDFERIVNLLALSDEKAKELRKKDKILRYFLNKKEALLAVIMSILFIIMYVSTFKVNISKEVPINIELNCSILNKNKTIESNTTECKDIEYKDIELLDKFIIYYEKASIDIKELNKNNEFFEVQQKILVDINSLLKNLKSKNLYYIRITSNSSNEKVIKNNAFNNNYQISEARSNGVKKFIISKLLANNVFLNNIKFEIENRSNYDALSNNHNLSRSSQVEVYLIK